MRFFSVEHVEKLERSIGYLFNGWGSERFKRNESQRCAIDVWEVSVRNCGPGTTGELPAQQRSRINSRLPKGEQRQRYVLGVTGMDFAEPAENLGTSIHTEFYGDIFTSDTLCKSTLDGCLTRLPPVGRLDVRTNMMWDVARCPLCWMSRPSWRRTLWDGANCLAHL